MSTHSKSKKSAPAVGDAITYTTEGGAGPWPGKVLGEADDAGVYWIEVTKSTTRNAFRCGAIFGDKPGQFALAD